MSNESNSDAGNAHPPADKQDWPVIHVTLHPGTYAVIQDGAKTLHMAVDDFVVLIAYKCSKLKFFPGFP